MGTAAKLAIPLYVGDPADHAGCTFVVGMDADELLDGVPSTPARINSIDPDDTQFAEKFMLPEASAVGQLPVGFVGLVKTNLRANGGASETETSVEVDAGQGYGARVRFTFTEGSSVFCARRAPTSVTTTDYTGSHTDVDEDPFGVLDGNNCAFVGGGIGVGEIRFNFANAATAYTAGDEDQMFVMVDSQKDISVQTYELWQNGSKVADLLDYSRSIVEVSGDTTKYLTVIYFDASQLPSSTLGIQIKVVSTVAGAEPDDGNTIHAVGLYPTLSDGLLLYDSGWFVAIPDVTDTAFGNLPANYVGKLPSRNVFHWPTSIVETVGLVQAHIRDPFNADGYIDIGEMLAGARFEATINRDLGKLVDLKPLGTKTITAGGKHVGVAGKFLRSIHMPLSWMTPAEGAALLERIQRMNTLAPVAISLHSGSASEARLLSCYGSLGVAPEYAAPYALHRGTTIVVDEEL